jgi:hypothetical protein
VDSSTIENSWNEFLTTLSEKDGEGVLTQLKFPLMELFEKQCNIDRAWKALFKPERGQVLKLYLSSIDLDQLSDKMNTHRTLFVKGFGQDRFNHLKLLVRLKIINEEKKPKKGLLAV